VTLSLRNISFSNPQTVGQSFKDMAHFLLGKNSKLALQLDGRNRLDLLQVECARFQEWFWNGEFPAIPRSAVV
jgi:hypothetical protein